MGMRDRLEEMLRRRMGNGGPEGDAPFVDGAVNHWSAKSPDSGVAYDRADPSIMPAAKFAPEPAPEPPPPVFHPSFPEGPAELASKYEVKDSKPLGQSLALSALSRKPTAAPSMPPFGSSAPIDRTIVANAPPFGSTAPLDRPAPIDRVSALTQVAGAQAPPPSSTLTDTITKDRAESDAARKSSMELRLAAMLGRRGEQLGAAFDRSRRTKVDDAGFQAQMANADAPLRELAANRAEEDSAKAKAHGQEREQLGDTRYKSEHDEKTRQFNATIADAEAKEKSRHQEALDKAKTEQDRFAANQEHEKRMEQIAWYHAHQAGLSRQDMLDQRRKDATEKVTETEAGKIPKAVGDAGKFVQQYDEFKDIVGRNKDGIPGTGRVVGSILDLADKVSPGTSQSLIGIAEKLHGMTPQEARDAITSRNLIPQLRVGWERGLGARAASSPQMNEIFKSATGLINSGTSDGLKRGMEILYDNIAANVQQQRSGFSPAAVDRVQSRDPGFNLKGMKPGDNPMPVPGSAVGGSATATQRVRLPDGSVLERLPDGTIRRADTP